MKLNVEEEVVLFFSVLKWIILATIVGSLTGLVVTGFIYVIHFVIDQSNQYQYVFYLLPLSFFVTSLLSLFVIRNDLGTDRLIEAINQHYGKVKQGFIPTKVINVFIILATGGSAGKESPCAQIGAGLATVCANLFKVDDIDRKKMVICGFSAGFACVFGTPISGALFGIEVLAVGVIMYEVLLPAFVASITAYHISSSLGITFFHSPLNFVPTFEQAFFLKVLLAAAFFGLCANFMIKSIRVGEKFAEGLPLWAPWKGAIGGALLVILTLLFSREYLGLGLDQMEACLKGAFVPWYAFLLKALFTVITLSISRSGSVITPIFFIGATAGSAYAALFGLDKATFAAIGFVSMLAGTTNTPIATSIMAVEMFGADIAPYAAVSCVISFLMSGHRSLYSSQILKLTKSRAIEVAVGKELKEVQSQVRLGNQHLPYLLKKWFTIFRKRYRRL